MLTRKATGLTADQKQKISLGRGLVRADVAADPVRRAADRDRPAPEVGAALASSRSCTARFDLHDGLRHPRPDRGADLRRQGGGDVRGRGGADRHAGGAVRAARAHLRRLFHRLARHERPAGRRSRADRRGSAATTLALARSYGELPAGARIELGIRPEFVSIAAPATGLLPARSSASRISAATRSCGRALGGRNDRGHVAEDAESPAASRQSGLRSGAASTSMPTSLARRGERLMDKTCNNEGLAAGAAGVRAGGLPRGHPADDRGQLFGPGHVRQQPVLLGRRRLVRRSCSTPTELGGALAAAAQPRSSRRSCWRSRSRSASSSRWRCRARAGASPSAWSDGAAAADPVERRRHDLADLRPRRHRPARLHAVNGLGFDYNYVADPLDAWITIVVMDVWHWTPPGGAALLCRAACRSPTPTTRRPAIDGASRWAVFRYIQLPKMQRVLLIAVLLRFMDSFMIYTEPFVVTGGGPGNATTFLSIDLVKIARRPVRPRPGRGDVDRLLPDHPDRCAGSSTPS